jgi:type I restriction enzyme, S subunit
MNAAWTSTTIGDQATLQRGFDITRRQFIPGCTPVISSGGVIGYHSEAKSGGPGVVLGRKGTLGTVFYVEGEYWPHDTTLWVKDFHGNWPRYVYYFFKTLDAIRLDVGSANPTLNRNHVHPIAAPWAPLREQQAIAHVLGTLDDKIELNRRMNETLEEMARAIFKSWFVDFDPVKAKMDGRKPYGMDDETAALFPDSFEDSEIGRIPKGWSVHNLDGIAEFLNGLALQKYPAEGPEALPVVKIAELRNGISPKSGRASTDVPERYVVADGDLLFSWSGSLLAKLWSGGPGALNQHLFKVTSASHPRWFCYQWVLRHLPEFQRIAADKATTMGHIQRRHLAEAKTVSPPGPVLDGLGATIAPLIDRVVHNSLESRTLGSLRDALLPKLISGELDVRELTDLPIETA